MADEMVLKAQKWVNATYKNVAGYNACPENGKTGWPTMFSLTRALQHELGITALSDSFGPSTIGKIDARGGIKLDEKNKNLIKIVQAACFCKGYHAGDINGNFTLNTQGAVAKLMEDAGLNPALKGAVQAKVMKALLTMDAYVLQAGGTKKVRSIQQWLNGRYYGRSNFYLIPAEGHFSRDVQKALMKAIQYELGVPDEQATGNFGPSTKNGLKKHNIGQGDSGIWVQLFSAACVFNEPVGSYETTFKSTWDDKLTQFVQAFQRFSYLPQSKRGDFATWAQLLVSTGDPDRKGTGCDTSRRITAARAKDLYAAGYRIIGRYLAEPPGYNTEKPMTKKELADIFSAKLKVFPIWQYGARDLEDFRYSYGYQHGLRAHDTAEGLGFGAGTVIYFAVDYDATTEQIASNIVPYFNGVVAALNSRGKKYLHGVYGSRNVCAQVSKHTYARWSFVSGMSWGFSGNLGFPNPDNWSLNQIQEFSFNGPNGGSFPLDKDIWRPDTDPGVASVDKSANPAGAFVAYVSKLYDLAKAYGKGDPNRLVMQFCRSKKYNGTLWQTLLNPADAGFIAYAKGKGMEVLEEFNDPSTGYTLDPQHIMAAAEGQAKVGGPEFAYYGEIMGWAGDLYTLYAEWRRDSDNYSSGYKYCQDKLARPGVRSSFGYADLIEDTDGYLLGQDCKTKKKNIAQAVEAHYGDGGRFLKRFSHFFNDRFGGTAGKAKAAAHSMLTSSDGLVTTMRTGIIENQVKGVPTPSMLPSGKLDEYCQGFADALVERVGLE
ncbi:glycoside hydrolase domain-containing protein [Streptomyces sp. NPDC057743]|uniref:glycoside hydrolase domain-containing protein n=1 Tax=Streptomyces sp. NPDC057743 TaxID=3346236 RepID=UPI0036779137